MLEEEGVALAGCFVDLGGDAALSSVLMCLAGLERLEAGELDVVVKSEELLKLHRSRHKSDKKAPKLLDYVRGKPGDSAGPGQYDVHKARHS